MRSTIRTSYRWLRSIVPAFASQSAALHPLSLADTLSRSVIATIGGPKSRVTCAAAWRKPSMFSWPLVTSVPGTWTPRTDCRSSSLAMTTSTSRIIGPMTARACASVHSFFR